MTGRGTLGSMLHATIRQVEKHETEVAGESLEEIQEQLAANCPEGFELVEAPVAMAKASTQITAKATYMRRNNLREIQAETMPDLEALVPEGWQMLFTIRK